MFVRPKRPCYTEKFFLQHATQFSLKKKIASCGMSDGRCFTNFQDNFQRRLQVASSNNMYSRRDFHNSRPCRVRVLISLINVPEGTYIRNMYLFLLLVLLYMQTIILKMFIFKQQLTNELCPAKCSYNHHNTIIKWIYESFIHM